MLVFLDDYDRADCTEYDCIKLRRAGMDAEIRLFFMNLYRVLEIADRSPELFEHIDSDTKLENLMMDPTIAIYVAAYHLLSEKLIKLSDIDVEMLTLKYQMGLSVAELSQFYGCSEYWMKEWLNDAMDMLCCLD